MRKTVSAKSTKNNLEKTVAKDIKELSLEDLKQALLDFKYPAYHAAQIFDWIYQKQADSFSEMTNLPQALRQLLAEDFFVHSLRLEKKIQSQDKTEKFLFGLSDKNLIESVSIPAENRVTGCLSTQVGCKFSCLFCASGALGYKRNLTSGEIIDQALYLKKHSQNKKLTHIVFMGTGEPLDNYDNLLKAIRVINSSLGMNIGARRITISTSGVIPGIRKLSAEGLQVELSVSLHAADEKTRSMLMPVNRTYPLKALLAACKEYIDKTNRQVTFEYTLVKGMNSDLENAGKLSALLKGLNCKVNLIVCNPVSPVRNIDGFSNIPIFSNGVKEPGVKPLTKLEVLSFKNFLSKHGVEVTLRKSRGEDIEAACGQLRYRYDKK